MSHPAFLDASFILRKPLLFCWQRWLPATLDHPYPFRKSFGVSLSLAVPAKVLEKATIGLPWATLSNFMPVPMARRMKHSDRPDLIMCPHLKWMWVLPGLSYKKQEWGRDGFPKENGEMTILRAKAPDVTSDASVGTLATLPPET